jgi:hypothetical protein
MQITLDVSEDIARRFALSPEDLARATLEALALKGTRALRQTHHRTGPALAGLLDPLQSRGLP